MGNLSKNFSRSEFRCKCGICSFDTVDAVLIKYLEAIRRHFKSPVTITSGCRCQAHNIAIGGMPNSQHKVGRAADIVVRGVSPQAVADYAEILNCGGVGLYDDFTHIDSRTKSGARW